MCLVGRPVAVGVTPLLVWLVCVTGPGLVCVTSPVLQQGQVCPTPASFRAVGEAGSVYARCLKQCVCWSPQWCVR